MTLYTGWELPAPERKALLERFPPIYPDVIAHHVTLQFDVPEDTQPPSETVGVIVGHVDDQEGVQALVVSIGGTTDRPDGSTFHITWSIDRAVGRAPVHSNGVIHEYGYEPVEHHLINLTPRVFGRKPE